MKDIIEFLELAKDHLDAEEHSANDNQAAPLDNKEKTFRANVDSAYKIATMGFAVVAGIAGLVFPPSALIGASIALALALLHHFDKKRDYKLSHKLSQFWHKLVGKEENIGEQLKQIVEKHNQEKKAALLKELQEVPEFEFMEEKSTPVKVSLQKHGFFSKKFSPKSANELNKHRDCEIEMMALSK